MWTRHRSSISIQKGIWALAFALVFGLESNARGADFDLAMGSAGFARRDLLVTDEHDPVHFASDQKEVRITGNAL
jgi:hypothetical protein